MNKPECIKALMWYWGITKKEAEDHFESNSTEFNYDIWRTWKKHCKQSFEND